jgi:predicted outer membrane lipoprotein/sarcosine oxidase delta subunit
MRLTTFFALLLGLVIGVCATMALYVDRPGPDPGDWLGFAGALVGVVFTIVGTLWLEHYRTTANEREDRVILLATLDEIRNALTAVTAGRGNTPIADERASRIAAEAKLLKSFNKFFYARRYVPKRNIEAWHAIEELNEAICKERSIVEKEIGVITEAGENEAVLNVNISIMQQINGRIASALSSARNIVAEYEI